MLELEAGLNTVFEEFVQHHMAITFVILSHNNKKYGFVLLTLKFKREKNIPSF